MNLLDELTYIGKYTGSRIDLVQAGGGNISIKDENHLYIKSSGCILSEMNQSFGFSVVDMSKTTEFLKSLDNVSEEDFGEELNNLLIGDYKRPSIETPLHAILEKKVVIHVHPISIIGLTSQVDSEQIVKKLFPNSGWIKYATPGKQLALNFKDIYHKKNSIYFLENHGVVVAGNSYQEAISQLEETLDKCNKHLSIVADKSSSEIVKEFHSTFKSFLSVYQNENPELIQLFLDQTKTYSPICPDDVVYIGPDILILTELTSTNISRFLSKHNVLPKVLFYKNQFFFVDKNLIKAKQIYEQLYSNLKASSYIENKKSISKKEVGFLTNWEAEKYRQNIKD